jgi:hypothetical protein
VIRQVLSSKGSSGGSGRVHLGYTMRTSLDYRDRRRLPRWLFGSALRRGSANRGARADAELVPAIAGSTLQGAETRTHAGKGLLLASIFAF